MLVTDIYKDGKQNYLENIANNEAEDSSYDSECDDELHHQHQVAKLQQTNLHSQEKKQLTSTSSSGSGIEHEQVSRTSSDTLGQEFAEYVNTNELNTNVLTPDKIPNYTARVEFALKLGYTEKLVQAALGRLGPDPGQNELLAELIKLGAQYGNKSDFICDSPTSAECSGKLNFSKIGITSDCGISDLTLSSNSGNNIDENISHQITSQQLFNTLRPIVIDGSNVAMSHGNKEIFSCRGIKLCVEWFKNRGHKDITVFVPKWRKESSRPDNPIKDQDILNELERERMLVFTPSRLVGGKRMVCYDDRYILKLAVENDGVVVSNDNYRDLIQESSEFKKVVEERVLMYSFVNDRFMPPDDPLGRSGPTLDNFLRIQPKKGDPPPPCPYGKKCTYGNKCKFYHPERGSGPQKSVTERLSEHAARHLSARNSSSDPSARIPVQAKSLSVPLSSGEPLSTERTSHKTPLCRTRSGTPASSDCYNQEPSLLNTSALHQQNQFAIGWESAACHRNDPLQINFPKSHSIENISRDIYTHSMNSGCMGNTQQQQQQQQTHHQMLPHLNYPNMWAPPPGSQQQQHSKPLQSGDSGDESVNLHRKLRRQLTLNAAGCDPRIYQLQRCMTPGMNSSNSGGNSPAMMQSPGQTHSPHRPLAPSLSGPRNHHPGPTQWDLHQSVTRIASAPDPSRPWSSSLTESNMTSSEPHLWSQYSPGTHLASHEEKRRRLHYHLASIFPEEQVQTVMQLYPDETNPQTICAAILNIFPKI